MEDPVDFSHLKQLLALEAKYRLRPEIMDRFLAGGSLVTLDTYEPMIDAVFSMFLSRSGAGHLP